jgi:amidase
MKRRKFLLSSLLGSAAISAPFLNSCKQFTEKKVALATPEYQSELDEVTIPEMRSWLESNKYTSEDLVNMYLDRIRGIDKEGPTLNSIIEINPDAVSIAQQLDTERK